MNIEEMKKARLKEKAKEYQRNRSNPDPMSQKTFAESRKLTNVDSEQSRGNALSGRSMRKITLSLCHKKTR
jgi:hypothetical protein